jgi:DNA modification methylase
LREQVRQIARSIAAFGFINPVLVIKKGKGRHTNNVALGRHGRNRTNVWDYAGLGSFGEGRQESLAMHPTVKPVALVADALLDASTRGEVVLDGFAGSGSTLLAAERTGRVFRGIELDPRYVELALGRWQQVAGEARLTLPRRAPWQPADRRNVRRLAACAPQPSVQATRRR